jgi:hypothetical protein
MSLGPLICARRSVERVHEERMVMQVMLFDLE